MFMPSQNKKQGAEKMYFISTALHRINLINLCFCFYKKDIAKTTLQPLALSIWSLFKMCIVSYSVQVLIFLSITNCFFRIEKIKTTSIKAS